MQSTSVTYGYTGTAFLIHNIISYFQYLHFRYFYLLVWPTSLCAEYAFDCIPKVSHIKSPAKLASSIDSLCKYYTFIFGTRYNFELVMIRSMYVYLIIQVSSLDEPRASLGVGLYVILGISVLCAVWRAVIPTQAQLKELKGELNGSEGGRKKDKQKNLVNKTSLSEMNECEGVIDKKDQTSPMTSYEDSVGSAKWCVTAEHYLLSLVWLIVPFIPASGTQLFCLRSLPMSLYFSL